MQARYSHYALLADAVLEIEREMRRLALWTPEGSENVPSVQQLSSTEPFCIDTLHFPQWIQFVLLEKIRVLIEADADLPARSDIAPMAEEYFRPIPLSTDRLVEMIRELDRLITEA
ncbi:MAG: pseudouridine synthase [Alteromonadaceae bacterium]|nr:pseudouridine synthase [Alteromonadaceae bacterium]|tara:strand:- start:640 stop:987 length:348 start_codon:yes stop_codon:yes gene_type:complete